MDSPKKAILEELCRQDKPTYVIDKAQLRRNLQTLADIKTQSGCKIFLALKSFAVYSVYPFIAEFLDGVSASSLNEVRLGHEYFKKEIHTYSPAFDTHEIDEISRLSDHVIFNSVSQYERFLPTLTAHGRSPGLRLNVEKSVTNYPPYDPSRRYSRFGVSRIELDRHPLSVQPSGYLVHNACGSNKAGLDETLASLESKFGKELQSADWLNLGGSHYITNKNYDIGHLIAKIKALSSTYNLEVYLEPGYAVTANAGYLCARVVDVLENEKQIGILNVSPSAHFFFALEIDCPVDIVGAVPVGTTEHTYLLGGNTCLSADMIGEYSFTKPLQPGSPIILEDMIAYTMVRSTSFNGVQMPSIAILNEDYSLTHLRESDYADFKRKLA